MGGIEVFDEALELAHKMMTPKKRDAFVRALLKKVWDGQLDSDFVDQYAHYVWFRPMLRELDPELADAHDESGEWVTNQ